MTSIHLMQASMETFDTAGQARADFDHILSRRPLAVGFTELGKLSHRHALESACLNQEYRLHIGHGETGVAVRRAWTVPVDAGSLPVHPAGDGYGPRYLDWVTFRHQGETITVGEAHWVRRGTRQREEHRRRMTTASLEFLDDFGLGRDLAFMLGDTNTDDTDTRGSCGALWSAYAAHGVTTLYDELNVYPATGPGGGSIDMLASRDADHRVSATGYRVWKPLNSDHKQVSGYYHIRGL